MNKALGALFLSAICLACSNSDPEFGAVEGDGPDEPLDAGPLTLPNLDASTVVPSGDAGSPDAGPGVCQIMDVPSAPYLLAGLHPDASNALVYLKVTASRISQTIGNFAASAGTHLQDGTADGHAYSAATDLSVRDMTDAQVSVFLDQLTSVGFAPFFRNPGHDGWPTTGARHVHVVWVGAKMKLILRDQVRDFVVGKNALASHTAYKFHTWSKCWHDAIWARFLTENPATN